MHPQVSRQQAEVDKLKRDVELATSQALRGCTMNIHPLHDIRVLRGGLRKRKLRYTYCSGTLFMADFRLRNALKIKEQLLVEQVQPLSCTYIGLAYSSKPVPYSCIADVPAFSQSLRGRTWRQRRRRRSPSTYPLSLTLSFYRVSEPDQITVTSQVIVWEQENNKQGEKDIIEKLRQSQAKVKQLEQEKQATLTQFKALQSEIDTIKSEAKEQMELVEKRAL
eukprot:1364943-Amorphochlora_amoeboformis.AAC.3